MAARKSALRLSAPLRISLLYAVLGASWIWLTDERLFGVGRAIADLWLFSVGKGMLFVLLSALLIYVLVRHEERRRRAAATQLETVFDDAPLGVAATDAQGFITTWNRAAERVLGHTADSAIGRHAGELGIDVQGTGDGSSVDADIIRADGATVPMRLFAAPLHEPVGGRVLLFKDLSLQREAETAHRQIQKLDAVARLAGGMAQEFNNILTTVLGHAALLAETLPPGDERRENVDEVRHAAERAAALTRQLLVISGHYVAQPTLLDLSRLVADMRPVVDRIAGAAIDVDLRLHDAPWPVLCDEGQFQQLVINLVVNAREAMVDGGRIAVETHNVSRDVDDAAVPAGDYVLLRVADSGPGMDQDTLDRLFEPFFTTKLQATGLGLATVYGTAQQFGARIRVDSTPGTGTAVEIYWPRARRPHPAATSETAADPAGSATVLVVDDDPAVRQLAVRILQRAGHVVLAAESGEEALALVERGEAFDAVLADVVMPGMSGIELVEQLRARRPDLPVLLTSGNAAGSFHDATELHAGIGFIEKPYAPSDLVARLRGMLQPPAEG